MKLRLYLLLIAIFYLPVAGFAQGACYPAGVVLLDTGRPANGATVSVCTAGGTFPGCTSTTSLFTTPALSVSASNPVTTDTHGNFGFCAAAGVNYDLQVTGTGITPLTIKNLPLPITTPVTANALTSSSANPANVGLIKMATGDCLDWRNNANSGNIQLCKDSADALDASAFSVVRAISVKQGSATAGFGFLDANGVSHFFISGTSPYQNTFINGNGSGVIFLGSAAKTNVDDVTGNITMSGSTSGTTVLKPSAVASGTNTLPNGGNILSDTSTNTVTNKAISSASNTLSFTTNHQIFSSSGTFTIPAGVTAVKVTIVGGGAAGGGASTTNNGGGGGSGGSAVKWLTGLTPANTIAVTVGTGGTGVSNATGGNGTNSSIASGTQTITTVTSGGGTGGVDTGTTSLGGNGAVISTNGDINAGGSMGAAGGSSASLGGIGGSSIFGGAGGPGGGGAGNAATGPGSGGGGAGAAANAAGGNGANGIVIFEWVN